MLLQLCMVHESCTLRLLPSFPLSGILTMSREPQSWVDNMSAQKHPVSQTSLTFPGRGVRASSMWPLFHAEMMRLKRTRALYFPERPFMVDPQPHGAQDAQGRKSAKSESPGIGCLSNSQHCSMFRVINNLTTMSPCLSSATESQSWQRHRRHWEKLFPGF